MTATLEPARTTPLLSPTYRWATLGSTSLIFLSAFEELAVTTVMPTVTADLHGRSWYSAAFSLTLAGSVVGMVAAGLACDRLGPRRPILVAVAAFVAGLLVAGAAPDIGVFLVGRVLQGLGAGALVVAMYVLVGVVFAAVDHPRIFGAFAAAWVVPSLVGPTLAGAVTEAFSWRLVFLGVVVLALLATLAVRPALRGMEPTLSATPTSGGGSRRLLSAVLVAAGVLVLDLGGRGPGPTRVLVAVAGVAVVALALRPLVPAGTLRFRRGLPSVIALRGLIGGTFIASDIYPPYLLQDRYGVPAWLAGTTLTLGALGWAASSQVQARLGARLPSETALRRGSALLLVGVAGLLGTAALDLSVVPTVVLASATWTLAGAGMGLAYPRITTLVLAASDDSDRGGNSAAASVTDSLGCAVAIAVTGLVFTAVGPPDRQAPYVAALLVTTGLGFVAVVVSRRVGPAGASPD